MNNSLPVRLVLYCICFAFLISCAGVPAGIKPVSNFDLDRYLGEWFEIARLDHSFERGLSRVRASYSLNPDGSVRVINTGFSADDKEWREAIGKAQFVAARDSGHLKVSFFGPFYGSYVVFRLGDDYEYAFVSGYNRDFLWLLARTATVEQELLSDFEQTAKQLGFDIEQLIIVEQDQVQ